MATTIEMPQMDMEMQEGTVVRWLKAEGDSVAQGEVIAEIETDKAIVEVEAPTGGVLRQIAVEEGTTTPVGSVLGVIAAPDEETPAPDSLQTSSTETQRDTLSDDEQSIPLSRMRRVIAARTSRSVHEAPHFYVTAEIDMTRATEFRREFNDTSPQGVRVSTNDLIIKACAMAIKKYPNVNSHFQDNHLITSSHVNIGIAVALDQGLIIPAIPNCQDRDLVNISQASKDLIHRAQGGTLKPDEYAGGTFAISNLGMYDVDSFHRHHIPAQRRRAGHRLGEREAGGKGRPDNRSTNDEGHTVRRPPCHRRRRCRPVSPRSQAALGTPPNPHRLTTARSLLAPLAPPGSKPRGGLSSSKLASWRRTVERDRRGSHSVRLMRPTHVGDTVQASMLQLRLYP